MALSQAGKNWIAIHLGIGDCMTETQRAFTYHDSVENVDHADTGGTAVMLNRLIDNLVPYITIAGVRHNYSDLRTANGADVLYPEDVIWVGANDAGDSAHCDTGGGGNGGIPTTPTMDARVGTYDFTGAFCTGDPTGGITVPDDVTMHHTHSLVLNKKWFEINGVEISNTSACLAYFAVEMRMWSGTHSYCPTTTPAWKGMNRNVEEEFIRNIPIDVMKTEDMFFDYLIPEIGAGAGQLAAGTYTICLYVWANFSKYDLQNELEVVGYTNPEN